MIQFALLFAVGALAEGYCPVGWRQASRDEDEAEIRIHCRLARSSQEPIASADPVIEIPIRRRPGLLPNAAQALAGSRPDTHDALIRLAKSACDEPGGVSEEAWSRTFSWFGNGENLSGTQPAGLSPCARTLLLELESQNRSPTLGPFSSEWVNARARALKAPPPMPPPVRSPESCKGFWSEGRKWICVDP